MEFTIENGVLIRCEGNDRQIVIPNGVTRIGGRNVFKACTDTSSIVFPSGLTKIDDWAFHGTLQGVELHFANLEDFLAVESWGYPDPRGGRKIHIAGNLFTEVALPEEMEEIPAGAFIACSDLATVRLPSGLRKIGPSAFVGCISLEKLEIPDGVEEIGNGAFSNCANLKGIKLPANLQEIKAGTFARCTSLEAITIPPSVTKIEQRAFEQCDKLKSISIPESVEYIGEFAFTGCLSLKEISLYPEKTQLHEEAFNLCYHVEKYNILPDGVKVSSKLPTSLLKIYFLKFDPEEMAWIGLYQGDKKWKEWFYDKMEDGGSKVINKVAISMSGILKANGKIPKLVQDRVADFMTKFKKKIKPENAQAIQECFGDASTGVQKTPKKEPKQLSISEIIQKGKTRTTAWFEKRSISPDSFSEVKVVNGANVSAVDAAMFVMYEYGRQMQKDPAYHAKTYKSDYVEVKFSEDAEKIALLLDKETLKMSIKQCTPFLNILLDSSDLSEEEETLPELYPDGPRILKYVLNDQPFFQTPNQIEEEHYGFSKFTLSSNSSWNKPFVSGLEYFLPYARFADSEEVNNMIKTAENLMKNWVIPGRTAAIAIRSALLLNDTKEAMDYLDKYDMLTIYAKMRGITVSSLRSKKSKTDLKPDGTMVFDL